MGWWRGREREREAGKPLTRFALLLRSSNLEPILFPVSPCLCPVLTGLCSSSLPPSCLKNISWYISVMRGLDLPCPLPDSCLAALVIDVIRTMVIPSLACSHCIFTQHSLGSQAPSSARFPFVVFFFILLGVVFKLNHAFLFGFFSFTPVFPNATNVVDLGNGINIKLGCPSEICLIPQEARLCTPGLRKARITEGRILWRPVCVHIMDKY